jgi:hypothetical protein
MQRQKDRHIGVSEKGFLRDTTFTPQSWRLESFRRGQQKVKTWGVLLLSLYWLVLCVNLTQAGVITEKGVSVRKMPPWDPAVSIFSISDQEGKAPCGWDHLWAGSLGFYKRAGWASQGKQASKEHPSMASASAPASWPAWVPVLTSFSDEQQCRSVSWINPFLPNCFLIMMFVQEWKPWLRQL